MTVRFDLIGLAVHDIPRSLAFYRLLGLDIPQDEDSQDHVEHPLDGIRLAWDSVSMLKGVYGEWDEHPRGHRIEMAFKCENAEEVDRIYRRIVEAGHRGHREPWDAFWGQRYAIVEDPDGNLISLFA